MQDLRRRARGLSGGSCSSGSPPFAAGVAQMIIAEVPTMAIDQVRAGAGPPLAIAAPQVG